MVETALQLGLTSTADFAPGERRRVESRNGLTLTWHLPEATPLATVVLAPGWSGPRSGPAEILVFLASELVRAGYACVRLDLPGRGDSSSFAQPVDLDAMIAAVARIAGDASKGGPSAVHLLGMCSGGNVSLGAATLGANFKSVVSISTLPFQPARSKTFEWRRRWKNLKQYARKALSPQTWRRLLGGEINLKRVGKNVSVSEKPAAGRNLKDSARDIERALLATHLPLLFVWGSGDEEAPPARAYFEQLHARGMGARNACEFVTVDGANHNFYGRAWRQDLSERLLAFLKRAA